MGTYYCTDTRELVLLITVQLILALLITESLKIGILLILNSWRSSYGLSWLYWNCTLDKL